MSDSFAPIADIAIGAIPDDTRVSGRTLFQRLLDGEEVGTVIVMDFVSRPINPAPVGYYPPGAIGDLPIADIEGLLAGTGPDERSFVGDGAWCGRPDDFAAAHLEAETTLIDLGDIQEEAPYLPEQDRRATTTVATARLANGDGRYDSFFGRRTVDGQRVRAWLTDDRDGYTSEWILILDSLAESFDPSVDEALLTLANVADRLETPALRGTYAGTGGANGDARLAGKYFPLAFGDCFNVEPDAESFANSIDRWSEGRVNDITAVRDGGAPLLWDGVDYPDYASLFNATVAPGFYTKATAIGRTKRGNTAVFRITGDVSAPLNTTAEILLALARGAAALPESRINAASFGVLPTHPVDLFIKGDRAVTVAEIFDALLRPFNAHYGSLGSAELSVGIVAEPSAAVSQWAVESHEIDAPGPDITKFDEPPRYRVGVTGARNWTPLAASELVDWRENPALTEAMWQRLQKAEDMLIAEDLGVKIRHIGAIDSIQKFGAVRGYFTTAAGAQAAADALFAFLKRPHRRVTVKTGLNEIHTRPGQAGVVSLESRAALLDQKPAVVFRRAFSAAARGVTLTMMATVDA